MRDFERVQTDFTSQLPESPVYWKDKQDAADCCGHGTPHEPRSHSVVNAVCVFGTGEYQRAGAVALLPPCCFDMLVVHVDFVADAGDVRGQTEHDLIDTCWQGGDHERFGFARVCFEGTPEVISTPAS